MREFYEMTWCGWRMDDEIVLAKDNLFIKEINGITIEYHFVGKYSIAIISVKTYSPVKHLAYIMKIVINHSTYIPCCI
jgi:hypothetical protein